MTARIGWYIDILRIGALGDQVPCQMPVTNIIVEPTASHKVGLL